MLSFHDTTTDGDDDDDMEDLRAPLLDARGETGIGGAGGWKYEAESGVNARGGSGRSGRRRCTAAGRRRLGSRKVGGASSSCRRRAFATRWRAA
ncbi:hypothetical protein U9M48_021383 [Paspalum notatum var. saurae]|uniref:Uncharacterized protein n=1 Tax=Paspalum notatum var. saurae TaxID=547442 RepID=A0AAQ3WTI7_PASNO